jgi:hypothetical protein
MDSTRYCGMNRSFPFALSLLHYFDVPADTCMFDFLKERGSRLLTLQCRSARCNKSLVHSWLLS